MCLTFNLHLTKEELRRLAKISNEGIQNANQYSNGMDSMGNNINYMQLSKNLGLHKHSLNQIQLANSAFNRDT